MPDASVDAVVTDPPYELGFMGKAWDSVGVANDVRMWAQVLRVLKPGGHLLAFGATRTYHRMTCAIEDVGFEIRDSLHWVYGSGFPKSLDVSKAIDNAAGAEREVVGVGAAACEWIERGEPCGGHGDDNGRYGETVHAPATAPATDAARQWSGWGTALKPAHEPIVVARKPLTGTVAANVLTHSTGALNIDGCRVGSEVVQVNTSDDRHAFCESQVGNDYQSKTTTGRWPANLVFTHAADCAQVAPGSSTSTPAEEVAGGIWAPSEGKPAGPTYSDTPAVWRCAPGCPVAELDGQSGHLHAAGSRSERGNRSPFTGGTTALAADHAYVTDSGGASRFFTVTEWDPTADVPPFRYVAKPSKRERNAGLDGLEERNKYKAGGVGGTGGWRDVDKAVNATPVANHHPTVKPVALMRWLVRLVTPPGGTVLDPFAGSGTTLVAAVLEGFDALGIEMTDDYLPIIDGLIAWAETQAAAPPDTLFDPRTAT
jgi:site-specific DNA-methyltransferase (adenine-specific)